MSDSPTDARLAALLNDVGKAESDPEFSERVLALAAYDLRLRRARREAISQVGWEAVGLLSVIVLFVLLARIGPPAGMSDALSANSPAMLGVILLLLFGLIGGRGSLVIPR